MRFKAWQNVFRWFYSLLRYIMPGNLLRYIMPGNLLRYIMPGTSLRLWRWLFMPGTNKEKRLDSMRFKAWQNVFRWFYSLLRYIMPGTSLRYCALWGWLFMPGTLLRYCALWRWLFMPGTNKEKRLAPIHHARNLSPILCFMKMAFHARNLAPIMKMAFHARNLAPILCFMKMAFHARNQQRKATWFYAIQGMAKCF